MRSYRETEPGCITWSEDGKSGFFKQGAIATRQVQTGVHKVEVEPGKFSEEPIFETEQYFPYDEFLASANEHGIKIHWLTKPTTKELLDKALMEGLNVQRLAADKARKAMLSPAYSELDEASFDKQEEEANLVLSGATIGLDLLPGMAIERGITLDEMAQKVRDKAKLFSKLTGKVLGTRQRIEKQMKAAHAANDLAELERLNSIAEAEILGVLSQK